MSSELQPVEAWPSPRRAIPAHLLAPRRRPLCEMPDQALSWKRNSMEGLFAGRPKRAPATMNDEGLADASAANPFRLPRLYPGIDAATVSFHPEGASGGLESEKFGGAAAAGIFVAAPGDGLFDAVTLKSGRLSPRLASRTKCEPGSRCPRSGRGEGGSSTPPSRSRRSNACASAQAVTSTLATLSVLRCTLADSDSRTRLRRAAP